MANRSAVEPAVADRFRLLVDQLAREAGRPARGWQAQVARQLGLSRSYITRYLDEEIAVGAAAIDRACETLGLRPEFFDTSKGYRRPNYRRFLLARRPPVAARGARRSRTWRDLHSQGLALTARLGRGEAIAAEIHGLALDVLASPVVGAASRIGRLNPARVGNIEVILREGRGMLTALASGPSAALDDTAPMFEPEVP